MCITNMDDQRIIIIIFENNNNRINQREKNTILMKMNWSTIYRLTECMPSTQSEHGQWKLAKTQNIYLVYEIAPTAKSFRQCFFRLHFAISRRNIN